MKSMSGKVVSPSLCANSLLLPSYLGNPGAQSKHYTIYGIYLQYILCVVISQYRKINNSGWGGGFGEEGGGFACVYISIYLLF